MKGNPPLGGNSCLKTQQNPHNSTDLILMVCKEHLLNKKEAAHKEESELQLQ